jgi:hypothetical protein
MFPDNNWYGHRSVLFSYLGLKDREIFASLQHGWQSQFINPIQEKKNIYPSLYWSQETVEYLKKKKIENVHAIGAPFLYLCKLQEIKKDKKTFTKGTLVFPAHSSQDLKHITKHNLLISEVESNFNGPYTVCFYYYDLNEKDISIYEKKNWNVVCCVKNKTDKFSLLRLYNQILKHENVVSGEFSSAIFYSMFLKKKTRLMFNSNERYNYYTKNEIKFINLYKNFYPELFESYLSAEKGEKLSKQELGFSSLKSQEQLKNLLGCNSIYKNLASKMCSYLYDFKYGSGLRKGRDLTNKELKKYISSVD